MTLTRLARWRTTAPSSIRGARLCWPHAAELRRQHPEVKVEALSGGERKHVACDLCVPSNGDAPSTTRFAPESAPASGPWTADRPPGRCVSVARSDAQTSTASSGVGTPDRPKSRQHEAASVTGNHGSTGAHSHGVSAVSVSAARPRRAPLVSLPNSNHQRGPRSAQPSREDGARSARERSKALPRRGETASQRAEAAGALSRELASTASQSTKDGATTRATSRELLRRRSA
jgi:hypothetical protein